ncbi:hypothetical protein BH09PSE6_BH09PSE6_04490 [soil metagenome]
MNRFCIGPIAAAALALCLLSSAAAAQRSHDIEPPTGVPAAVIRAGAAIQPQLWALDDWYLDQLEPLTRQRLAVMNPADGWLSPTTTVTADGNRRALERRFRIVELLEREVQLQDDYSKRLVALAQDPAIPASSRKAFTTFVTGYAQVFIDHRKNAAASLNRFLAGLVEQFTRNYDLVQSGGAIVQDNEVSYTDEYLPGAQQLRQAINGWSLEHQALEQAMAAEMPRPSQIRWQ